jgi:hypothetical protein
MMSTKIFYLSLLSVSWMSAINAGLNTDPEVTLKWFLGRISLPHDTWKDAFKEINTEKDRPVLDNFFKEKIDRLKQSVGVYENKMIHDDVDYAEQSAPLPDGALNTELNGLPRLSFLIRYSNLDVLNNIKLSGIDHPTLATVNTESLAMLPNIYKSIPQTPPVRDFQGFIVDLAVLYAINEEILPVIETKLPEHHSKLHIHHLMISDLLPDMVKFMKIRTRVPYVAVVRKLEEDLNERLGIESRGYLHIDIQVLFYRVSNLIIFTVSIYGSPSKTGVEWLSSLISTQAAVRRFVGIDLPPPYFDPYYHPSLLTAFDTVIGLIADESVGSPERNPPWFDQLRPIKNLMMKLLGPVP